jgi:hypothetical protein
MYWSRDVRPWEINVHPPFGWCEGIFGFRLFINKVMVKIAESQKPSQMYGCENE